MQCKWRMKSWKLRENRRCSYYSYGEPLAYDVDTYLTYLKVLKPPKIPYDSKIYDLRRDLTGAALSALSEDIVSQSASVGG